MKSSSRYLLTALLGSALVSLNSCVTDEYGNSAVSPGGAVAIALGAAVVGAAIAESDSRDHHRHEDWHDYHHHHHHHCAYY